jgi:hypothetical protein
MTKPKLVSGDEVDQTKPETNSTPTDAVDFASLWVDPQLGDAITDSSFHSVTAAKPKDFFRTVTDASYRKRTEIYVHKPEGAIDEEVFIIAPEMRGRIDEAQPCVLVTVVYRDGSPRIWPIKLPKEGKKDNEAWMSARSVAKTGLEKWVKLIWVGRAYRGRDALPGYAPDPDFSKLPPFDDLVKLAFGVAGVIRDTNHPVYRELFGAPPSKADDDDVDL